MRTTLTIGALVALTLAHDIVAGQPSSGARWRTAWATSQQALGNTAVSNTTVRLIARVTIGGDAVRIRIDNTYGTTPLKIGKASIGVRSSGATLVAGSNQPVRFGGADGVTVPPGGSVRSDAVTFRAIARQDLAVSLFVPDEKVQSSQHSGAVVTSYIAAPGAGDRTAVETNEPFKETTRAMPWLKAIDVQSSSSTGTIIAFGDSITD